jgi:hypothetical protein
MTGILSNIAAGKTIEPLARQVSPQVGHRPFLPTGRQEPQLLRRASRRGAPRPAPRLLRYVALV